MHGGIFKAYSKNMPRMTAFTNTQGHNPQNTRAGLADPSATVFQEMINTPNQSKINDFADRAAAALSIPKAELVIEDLHGNKYDKLAQDVKDGGPVGPATEYQT